MLSNFDWLDVSGSSAARISVDDAKSLHESFLAKDTFDEHSFCYAADPALGLRVGGFKFGQLMQVASRVHARTEFARALADQQANDVRVKIPRLNKFAIGNLVQFRNACG